MKFLKFTLPLIAIMMIGSLEAKASSKTKVAQKAYLFGFVANFTDSVVYFTDIQVVDSVWYDKKNKFLLGRSGYSNQLRDYFTTNMNKHNSTCIVIFALSRKEAEKKYLKLKKQYTGKNAGRYNLRNINENEFRFKPIDMSPEEN